VERGGEGRMTVTERRQKKNIPVRLFLFEKLFMSTESNNISLHLGIVAFSWAALDRSGGTVWSLQLPALSLFPQIPARLGERTSRVTSLFYLLSGEGG
jgi:hypothetical protein